jgi:hypothetical protein
MREHPNRLDSAASRRRMVEAAACPVSTMLRSQAITVRWSTRRSSSVVLSARLRMKWRTSSR